MKKYKVELADEERAALRDVIRRGRRGKISRRKITRAHLLLLADAGASNPEVAAALGVRAQTVCRTRRRYVEEGLAALEDRPRPGPPRLMGDEGESRLAAEARR